MLKLYLYGYRNNIRSSRKLEAACVTNIEVMWMPGGLRPDFRTISDFRKDNADNLKEVFKEFIKRVTVDLETGYVSIDGSKFKAWNGKDSNFTIMKLDDRIKWLEDHTQEYLRLIEEADKEEEAASGKLTREEAEKPGKKSRKKAKYHFEKKKVVRFKLRPDREKMNQRMCISEHPFGTIKREMGAACFLLKGKQKVGGDIEK